MRLHGRLADAELVGDLLVLVALDHEREHTPLLRRQLCGALGKGIGGLGLGGWVLVGSGVPVLAAVYGLRHAFRRSDATEGVRS